MNYKNVDLIKNYNYDSKLIFVKVYMRNNKFFCQNILIFHCRFRIKQVVVVML